MATLPGLSLPFTLQDNVSPGLQRAQRNVDNSARHIQRSTGAMRQGFAQAGFQLQDFVIQVQSGTPVLRAFVQQGSQIASAFGPAGIAIGTVGTLAAVAGGALFGLTKDAAAAGDEASRAKDAYERLTSAFEFQGKEIDELISSYRTLTEVQQTQARLELGQAVQETTKQVAKQREQLRGILGDIESLAEDMEQRLRSLRELEAVGVREMGALGSGVQVQRPGPEFAERLEREAEFARELIDLIEQAQAGTVPLARVSQEIAEMIQSTGGLSANMADLTKSLLSSTRGLIELQRAGEQTGETLDQITAITDEQAAALERLSKREEIAARRALEEVVQASRERERQMERERRAREQLADLRTDTIEGLQREARNTARLAAAHQQGADAVAHVRQQIEAENVARKLGFSIGSAEFQQISQLIGARSAFEQSIKDTTEARREEQRVAEEFAREQERLAEQRADIMVRPIHTALENVQDAFAGTFEDIFRGSVDTFKDLARSIRDIFVRLAAELAALRIFQPVLAGGGLAGLGFGGPTTLGQVQGLFGPGSLAAGTFAATRGRGGLFGTGVPIGGLLTSATFGGLGGSLAGSLFGGRGGLGGGLGGALGAAGGFGLGSIGALGGAVGGPLGAIVGGVGGSLLGGVIGSLFGGGPSNQQQGVSIFRDSVRQFGSTGSKFNAELRQAVDALGGQVQTFLRGIEDLTGERFRQNVQIAIGQRDPSRIRIGRGSIFDPGTLRGPVGDAQAALRIAFEQIAENFDRLSNLQQRVLQRSVQLRGPDVGAILGDIRFAQELTDTVTQISAVEQEIRAVNSRFDELRETARELGVATRLLDRAEREALRGLIEQREAALASIAEQARGFFSGLLDPLRQFQAEVLRGAGSPGQAFGLLQEQFQSTLAAARGGNLAAIGQIPQLGRALIQQAGQFGASPLVAQLSGQIVPGVQDVIGQIEREQARVMEDLPASIDRSIRGQTDALVEKIDETNEGLDRVERAIRQLKL